jgi:alanyl-tRNA synthetase
MAGCCRDLLLVPQAFFLYDSKGFPLDLTQRMAEEAGLTVDIAGYNRCMEAQRELGRIARTAHAVGRNLVLEAAQTSHLAETLKVAPTVDAGKYVWFQKPVATVKAIYTPAGFLTADQVATPETEVVSSHVSPLIFMCSDSSWLQFGVILDSTSFYAESGGQIYDTGVLSVVDASAASKADDDDDAVVPSTATIAVTNVQSFAGYVLHIGTVESGSLRVGDFVRCEVDYERRTDVAPNHTMTHTLNYALRKVRACVGSHTRETR